MNARKDEEAELNSKIVHCYKTLFLRAVLMTFLCLVFIQGFAFTLARLGCSFTLYLKIALGLILIISVIYTLIPTIKELEKIVEAKRRLKS